jgi:hypothetical protein
LKKISIAVVAAVALGLGTTPDKAIVFGKYILGAGTS